MAQKQQISVRNIDKVWSYKHFFVGRRKFCTVRGDSKKFCNSVAVINGRFHTLSKALLIQYNTGESVPVVFSNELIVDALHYLTQANSVYKVTGQSTKISITNCKYIYNIKCITIYDEQEKLSYLCKLMNSTELE